MNREEYQSYDGLGLAELVKQKEVTPEELRQMALGLLDAWDPQLNVVTRRLEDLAAKALADGLPEGPFHGVPTLLKESLAVEGIPFTLASVLLKDNVAASNHVLVDRMAATGVFYLAHTNMSEFGLLPYTESALFGPCRNPWNQAISTGGSSGGSAAAIAAGIVPFAAGGDGGGSIRIPASACGVFGLKPSRGRNPNELNAPPDGFVSYHILSRSVRDSAVMLDATYGALPGERWSLPAPEAPYADVIERDPEPLRIAFSTKNTIGQRADADNCRAIEQMARQCEALGHRVEEAAPPIDGEAFNEAFKVLWAQVPGHILNEARRTIAAHPKLPGFLRNILQNRSLLRWLTGVYKRDGKPLLEPFSRLCAKIEATYTAADLWHAWNIMRQVEAGIASYFTNDADLLLTPVLGALPSPIGTYQQEWGQQKAEAFLTEYAGFTPIANACGFPAMSVPTYWSKDGIPVGAHFMAPHAREDRLLQLAAQLERAHPWFDQYKKIKQPPT